VNSKSLPKFYFLSRLPCPSPERFSFGAMLPATIVFLFLYALLIGYYLYHWLRLKEVKPSSPGPPVFISVVIAARNEEQNLPMLLFSLKRQDYPSHLFEVIVSDDASTDRTAEAAAPFLKSGFRLVRSEGGSKKSAISFGISQAKGALIVVTDADCIVKPGWLSAIAGFYRSQHLEFIAAPVRFSNDGSVLQVFQALDFMVLQGITAAAVSAKFHSMCNGANLAYSREAFNSVGGFEGIDRVATGDDMLLMHKIGKSFPGKTGYLFSRDAIVETAPMPTWKDFFSQRKRWASKTFVYDDARIIPVLVFVYLFNCWFWALLIAGFFTASCWDYAAIFWIAKTLIELPFVYRVARFFDAADLLKYFFFFQPLHMLYTMLAGFLSQLGKYEWKGRRTK
jgi:cellulose synthase/poly-beta-1,6-N-acetylglucosamine synthase-like glycosyltransferase